MHIRRSACAPAGLRSRPALHRTPDMRHIHVTGTRHTLHVTHHMQLPGKPRGRHPAPHQPQTPSLSCSSCPLFERAPLHPPSQLRGAIARETCRRLAILLLLLLLLLREEGRLLKNKHYATAAAAAADATIAAAGGCLSRTRGRKQRRSNARG